jgi:hypothetical protein
MKLIVLYREDGSIVALSREPESAQDEPGISVPRSGVEPDKGQRVVTIEVDDRWKERSPVEILERFVVNGNGEQAHFKERRPKEGRSKKKELRKPIAS